MGVIIKRELKNYLKNPVFLVGAMLTFIGIYSNLSPYLQLHYFKSDEQIKSIEVEIISDADVMDGYITTTPNERLERGLKDIKQSLIDYYLMSEEEAEATMADIKANNETIPEMCKYLETKYNYYNAIYAFEESGIKQGSAEEVNAYIKDKFKEHDYSWYFARKFADFAGLYSVFFATILLAFLFIWDMKRDTYELLHTKSITASQYVLGKIVGGFISIMLVLGVIAAIFTILCILHGKTEGFPVSITVSIMDIFTAILLYIVPNIVVVVCIYAVIALVFKTPLPAVPLIILYAIYSNMGSVSADGIYGFYGRPLGILVRFPGMLLETTPPPMVLLNQIFLLLFAGVLIFIAIMVWKRRRIY